MPAVSQQDPANLRSGIGNGGTHAPVLREGHVCRSDER
jgi:hypothetical protein